MRAILYSKRAAKNTSYCQNTTAAHVGRAGYLDPVGKQLQSQGQEPMELGLARCLELGKEQQVVLRSDLEATAVGLLNGLDVGEEGGKNQG